MFFLIVKLLYLSHNSTFGYIASNVKTDQFPVSSMVDLFFPSKIHLTEQNQAHTHIYMKLRKVTEYSIMIFQKREIQKSMVKHTVSQTSCQWILHH